MKQNTQTTPVNTVWFYSGTQSEKKTHSEHPVNTVWFSALHRVKKTYCEHSVNTVWFYRGTQSEKTQCGVVHSVK